jgi:RNA polymerase sigma factor for flagellar operon FliA
MRLTPAPAIDLEQRDELVLAHVDLVRSLAHQVGRRLPSHVDRSELVSVGVLGLIDAAQRYQPALGVPFDAFARRRIHGAMLDALRRLDHVPRSVRRLKRDLDQALTELRHQLGREPAAAEIAVALGVTIDAYDGMLDELCVAGLAMTERAPSERNPGELLGLTVDGDGPYAQLERRELRAQLARALADLPDRERQILALSYQQELTLAEIGQVIGVGESRVSQLRTQAIARLRSRLRAWLHASRAA